MNDEMKAELATNFYQNHFTEVKEQTFEENAQKFLGEEFEAFFVMGETLESVALMQADNTAVVIMSMLSALLHAAWIEGRKSVTQ